MTLSMLSIAIIDVASKGVYNNAAGILLVLFLATFNVGSTAGPGATGKSLALVTGQALMGRAPIGWVYTGESGSARLRAKTTTLGTCGNVSLPPASQKCANTDCQITKALVGLVFNSALPYMLTVWGAKSGFLFAGLGSISCVCVYLFIPDFTGRVSPDTFSMACSF